MGESQEAKQSIPETAAPSIIFEASWFFGGLTHGTGMRWAGSPRPAPQRGEELLSPPPPPEPVPHPKPLAWAGRSHMFAELGFLGDFFFSIPLLFAFFFFLRGSIPHLLFFFIFIGLSTGKA